MMEQQMQVIVFKVGEELYAIDVSYIRGIEKMVPIVRIPANVPHVKGIINLRGEVIPVLSLRSKFGLQDAAITEDNRMLIKICLTADANAQAGLERACRLYCKDAFDNAGIKMPAAYTMLSEQKALG